MHFFLFKYWLYIMKEKSSEIMLKIKGSVTCLRGVAGTDEVDLPTVVSDIEKIERAVTAARTKIDITTTDAVSDIKTAVAPLQGAAVGPESTPVQSTPAQSVPAQSVGTKPERFEDPTSVARRQAGGINILMVPMSAQAYAIALKLASLSPFKPEVFYEHHLLNSLLRLEEHNELEERNE